MSNYRDRLGLYLTTDELKRAIDWRIINEDLLSMNDQTPMEELAEALAGHDWTYMYSDSPSAYHRGERQADAIERLLKLTGADGRALYEKARGPKLGRIG
tara:strand:+ start:1473 stop:1772 length:300 start_codon:yes stop_codon:yes gene_type:complete